MPTAKKATLSDAHVKVLVWGEPGSGKSRFGLSAPHPLVIDLEGSTGLYANQFDFYVAKLDKNNPKAENTCKLTTTIIDEIWAEEYPEIETLVVDPVTDMLDELEKFCAYQYEQQIGKSVQSLNALQKTKWYAYRRDQARIMIDKLKALPLNLVLIARSKSVWGKDSDGNTSPIGDTFDANPIVESLMDVVINLKKSKRNEYVAEIKKSRLGNLPDVLDVKDYSSIIKALETCKSNVPEPTDKSAKKQTPRG